MLPFITLPRRRPQQWVEQWVDRDGCLAHIPHRGPGADRRGECELLCVCSLLCCSFVSQEFSPWGLGKRVVIRIQLVLKVSQDRAKNLGREAEAALLANGLSGITPS